MFGKSGREWVREFYDSVNRKDLEGCLKLIHEDAEEVDTALGETTHGRENLGRYIQGWFTAFPDLHIELQNVVESGDWVVAEFLARGTNNGPLQGFGGQQLPPTGKHVELHVCDVSQLKDDKFYRGRLYYDLAGLMRQLGVMPTELAA